MITSQKRVTALSAPTGFGKSPTVIAAALLSGLPTCIVTNSRGLQDQYMCLAAGTLVCTSDLRWVPIENINAGDHLVGFDEYRSPNRRNWKDAVVMANPVSRQPCYRIVLEDGKQLICSWQHGWLVGDSKGHGLHWTKTEHLRVGDALNKVLDVWEYEHDYATGYLAAAFDGEGHLHQSKNTTNGRDVNLSFAQVDNIMLRQVEKYLTKKGFQYYINGDNKSSKNPKHKNCNRVTVGGRRNVMRFLGEIRPQRLLEKLDMDMMGMMNPAKPMRIALIEYVGAHYVYALQTSTYTYVAEGYASHNSDFAGIGLVDIRGRANYQCDMREDYTCEDGYTSRCPYKGTIGCPASQAEMRAASSPLVVTNYDKWTSSRKFGQGMAHFQQVIFDEGHDAPDALARAMQVYISSDDVESTLKMDYPAMVESFESWKKWAFYAKELATFLFMDMQQQISDASDPKPSWIKKYGHLRNLVRKLDTLAKASPTEWVVDEVDHGYQFDPIRPARYAEQMLLMRIPRILIVSATIRPKTLYMLGVGKANFDFIEFTSDFSKERCPIYWVPTMRVDSRASDLGMLWLRLDQIAAKRQDRKGIVHTISYARRDEIVGRSRFAPRMFINQRGEPPTFMVDAFKAAGPGAILVSPSVGTGYDFPMRDCEWQFLCKIPFPDSRSKIIQARQADDKEYGPYQAAQTLVQAFGRGNRSKQDQCENFIGDDHMAWFLPRYGHLFPKSFHGFFRKINVLPPPPEAL